MKWAASRPSYYSNVLPERGDEAKREKSCRSYACENLAAFACEHGAWLVSARSLRKNNHGASRRLKMERGTRNGLNRACASTTVVENANFRPMKPTRRHFRFMKPAP